VEGRTEKAFKPHLIKFLKESLVGRMPRLDMSVYHGRIDVGEKLRRKVEMLLGGGEPAEAVIALTDVYTGNPKYFLDASDAKAKMRKWVGANPQFHPHVAQYDFEAWLLPYWSEIQKITGSDRRAPQGNPESVNHDHPPSHHISDIFKSRSCPRNYSKTRDADRILRGKDLTIAAARCPELKAFLNTILTLSGGQTL
jgi:hypothetical protein